MLMSPDSSHNSAAPSSQPTSVIRLQVQECSSNWNGGNSSTHVSSNHHQIQAPPPPPPPIPSNYLNNHHHHHQQHQQQQPQQHHSQRTFVYNQPPPSHYSNVRDSGDIKKYPLMDTTVASSVKGEPELNIGNV